jgi:hypothetical protein
LAERVSDEENEQDGVMWNHCSQTQFLM